MADQRNATLEFQLPPALQTLTPELFKFEAMEAFFNHQQQSQRSIQLREAQTTAQRAIDQSLVSYQAILGQPQAQKHLGDPQAFVGNQSEYRVFEMALRAKLQIDGAHIASETNRVYYCFTRLAGKAAGMMQPWMAAYANNMAEFTVEKFIGQLQNTYLNPELERLASDKSRNMYQGKKSTIDYLADVDRTILEAKRWITRIRPIFRMQNGA